MLDNLKENWALILGGSSGLGLATAQKLARHGYHLVIVHRDRRADMSFIHQQFDDIRAMGVELRAFHIDATRSDKRREVIDDMQSFLTDGKLIKVMVHSIAKGNLKPISDAGVNGLGLQDFQLTIHAMALSFMSGRKTY